MSVALSYIQWDEAHRLISSRYPPVDLFDDIADPADWELLAKVESKTNPRIYDEIGDLSLVPADRRVSGTGASWVMAPFTHVSTDRPSRFTDGSYGVYYCARALETAIYETVYHRTRFLAASEQEPGWFTTMRQLVCRIDNEFHDIRTSFAGDTGIVGEIDKILDKDSYAASQKFGNALREEGSNGIVYPSQRHEGGECLAAFWPDVIGIPQQASHWQYHWNGDKIDYARQLDGDSEKSTIFAV